MPHDFEVSRQEHTIHNIGIPQSGHGHMEAKLEKKSRSPMIGRLPMDNGLEGAGNAPTLAEHEGSL